MSKYRSLILVISISVLFSGLVSAQERVQETRLLAKTGSKGQSLSESGALGSKLFAYSRIDKYGSGRNLFRLEGEREVPVLKPPFGVAIGESIYDVQVSRDESRIVFASSGVTWHFPTSIHSVRPDGSQLRILVKSGDDCGKRGPTGGHGPSQCSFPRAPRLSPDGQQILFFNEVDEWNEEKQGNVFHVYLSMIPVTGGPIVRLEEVGSGHAAVWSGDGTSIYYYSSEASNGTLLRYDLETGRSEPLTDELWEVWRLPLAVSQADGTLYFISNQGFVRLDPETGFAEVVSEKHLESFDLSPDGRRAVGIKEGEVMLVNLEFPSSTPLQVDSSAVDELELGQIPAARERWFTQKMSRKSTSAGLTELASQARKAIGVKQVRWLDNDRLWCVVQDNNSSQAIRVGIVRLY